MALVGVAPVEMRPTALALNVLVAGIGVIRFHRAGYFNWSKFWPFAVFSIPFAFIGGLLALPEVAYEPLVGLVLLYAAYRLLRPSARQAAEETTVLPRAVGPVAGSAIGFLSGLTGVGGGIFLSPLILLAGWTTVRETSAIAAAFILVNSIAGLGGLAASGTLETSLLPVLIPAALVGGLIGSELGSRRLSVSIIRRLLGAVLLIAGLKMVATTDFDGNASPPRAFNALSPAIRPSEEEL